MLANLSELYRMYKDVPVASLASLYARGRRLRSGSLLPARGPQGATAGPRPRLVISLTTTPGRIDRIRPVLNSLIDQQVPADAILLAVPWFSRREGVPYRIPDWLAASGAITLVRSDDWGPATKLIPAVAHESNPRTLILAVDDDVIYPPDLVATFRAWHDRWPDAALGYRGWSLPASLRWEETRTLYATSTPTVQAVDVLTGNWGYLVQPRFFDRALCDYSGYPAAAFFVDDIWISGQLARRGVPRLLVPGRLPPLSTAIGRVNGLIFRENRDGTKNNELIRAFADYWSCNAPGERVVLTANRAAMHQWAGRPGA